MCVCENYKVVYVEESTLYLKIEVKLDQSKTKV